MNIAATIPQIAQAEGYEEVTVLELFKRAAEFRGLVKFHNRLRDSKLPMFQAVAARTWTLNTSMAYCAALLDQIVDWSETQDQIVDWVEVEAQEA